MLQEQVPVTTVRPPQETVGRQTQPLDTPLFNREAWLYTARRGINQGLILVAVVVLELSIISLLTG